MRENALISVIVPIYKVERYLNKCLDSIVNQTYKELEIILVDDGSRVGAFAMNISVKTQELKLYIKRMQDLDWREIVGWKLQQVNMLHLLIRTILLI